MTGADNISVVLYRYLRTLSVKVSRDTVHRLLSTPLGGGTVSYTHLDVYKRQCLYRVEVLVS